MTQDPQTPLGSGLGMRTTANEAIGGRDLSGVNIIVTGGASGIGLETVRALAGAGAAVTVAVRRPDAAAEALAPLGGQISIAAMDLLDPASIDAFAATWLADHGVLGILINNAAVMANPLTRDAFGRESQFAANHLGHFRLTARLWPALRRAGEASGARVVALSSIGHRRGPVDLDDPYFERQPYEKWLAYARAKSANALFAVGLDARGKAHGVEAFSVHPGGIMTNLQRHLPIEEQRAMGWIDEAGVVNAIFKTPAQGAATTVWAAVSPLLKGRGGVYCEDCDIAVRYAEGMPGWSGVHPHAIDTQTAERLWSASEGWAGVSFP
jgi:NAD(P)-dependent dehydrogenase (short-subunit alcohol dehydrogenase family)